MAGDWIKMRTDLYRDPKVSVIAELLMAPDGDLARFVDQNRQRQMTVTRNVMRNVTVGALVSVWGVMRLRGKHVGDDLVCRGITSAVLDDIADLPGFGAAMVTVGWAIETDEGLVLPRFFEDQNVDPEDTAKRKNAERQKRFRERNSNESDDVDNVTHNVTVTHREEKRREEKKPKQAPIADALFADFWEQYPKKVSKTEAEKAFTKLRPDAELLAVILEGLERAKDSDQWVKDGGQFIPHAATWLNKRRWEDESSGQNVTPLFTGEKYY